MAGKNKAFQQSLIDHLAHSLAKDSYSATARDKFNSVVLSVRDRVAEQWLKTQERYYEANAKRIYYLSLEFLLGRLLKNYTLNLGLSGEYAEAVSILGLTFEDISEHEWDAGLGNGGLGRLAACFLDSMATMQYPGYGYGIRYEYGIFTQRIRDGYQLESPDNWLRYGSPWEFPRPEILYPVHFYGRVNCISGGNGKFRMEWTNADKVMAMAYDYPVPGFRNETVNTLRLWAAKSSREFNLAYFNDGDYISAVEDKNKSENISKVLYPDDHSLAGKELRLKQQFFFVSATIRDIIRRYKKLNQSYADLPEKAAVQLNDTHPSIAIAELMRILVDEDRVPWEDAWKITSRIFSYTNHTILPEALEVWPEEIMGYLLPRHLQIIQEIDRRFLVQVSMKFPAEHDRMAQMAIITDEGKRMINMARLSIVGSQAVNGVSSLHTDILKNNVFNSFHLMFPGKFQNITNGITPRRWLLEANAGLSGLISEAIGEGWLKDLGELKRLGPLAKDSEFCRRFRKIKAVNKAALSDFLKKNHKLPLNPELLLDCHVKRFHEYKRQMLNILHAITLYNRIREGRAGKAFTPRTILFAGKAAPGYYLCKLIIKLIHNLSAAVAAHPEASKKMQVVFVPNYGVTIAQRIIPAAELSEQISTAGYEASGTGNMKFALNGALTIGTLDGANVELRTEVGKDNFFLFGLTAEGIMNMRSKYNPRKHYEENPELRQAIDQISGGYFSPDDRGLFQPLVKSLMENDHFFVLADYAAYICCQEDVSISYKDEESWTMKAIHNVASSGKFSSDRAIQEYAQKIWNASPVPVSKF